MKKLEKQPITCSICGLSDTCSPCFFAEVDYKTRVGLCKNCAVQKENMNQLNPALAKRIAKENVEKSDAVVKAEREQRAASPRVVPQFDAPQLFIPRLFHFVWIGPNPLPEKDVLWLQSWRAHHPDWRFLIWCEYPEKVQLEGFESVSVPPLVNQHEYDFIANWVGDRAKLSARSDIIRAEVVARHGGIYLDTDVECFRPIDELLDGVRLCIAEEQRGERTGGNGSYLFGASKNHPASWELIRWLPGKLLEETKRIRAEMEARNGDWTWLNPVDCPGPHYINEHLKKHADCVVFPHMLFNPLSAYEDPEQVEVWPEISYANHHYAGKWYSRLKISPDKQFLESNKQRTA